MKRNVILGLAAALLAVSCGGGEIVATTAPSTTVSGPTAQLAELEAARQLWKAAPSDYTVSVDGATLAVRDEEIVSLAAPAVPVAEVFATIERSLREGAVVDVDYDAGLGYPTRLSIDRDGDGVPEVESSYGDLAAMPIVESLDQLLASKALWEAQGLDTYRYIFRADCTCPDGGTFDVEVRDGGLTRYVPIDEAATTSMLTPTTLAQAFADLEEWFTNSAGLIDEGTLAVDVRMDPELGYPRWFDVAGAALGDDAFADRFRIVVTIDLVLPYEPLPDEPADVDHPEDERALTAAQDRWEEAAIDDYRYLLTLHCECPLSHSGPFEITVRDGAPAGVVHLTDPSGARPDRVLIEDYFETIATAIAGGIDVDVTYDETLGYPRLMIVDTEAVAVDGGLALSIDEFVPLAAATGRLTGSVTAGPQCPVMQDPPQPGCEDAPVTVRLVVADAGGGEVVVAVVDGRFDVALAPGSYEIEAPPLEQYLGTPEPVVVTVTAGATTTIELYYDTGIR